MTCDECKFADWKRTANGRLHPSKAGMCKRLDVFPLDMRLPAAFYWIGHVGPKPSGGYIERDRQLKNGCEFKMKAEGRG